jgi:hypothetical protein
MLGAYLFRIKEFEDIWKYALEQIRDLLVKVKRKNE